MQISPGCTNKAELSCRVFHRLRSVTEQGRIERSRADSQVTVCKGTAGGLRLARLPCEYAGVRWRQAAQMRPAESLIADVRRHGLGMLGICLRMVLIAGVAGWVIGAIARWLPAQPQTARALQWVVVVLAALLTLSMVIRRFLGWTNARTLVTNQRIVIRYRLGKPGWNIPLLNVVDVTYSRGPLQRLLGVGVLKVQTNLAPEAAIIADVGHVHLLREEIISLRNDAWAQYYRSNAWQNSWQASA